MLINQCIGLLRGLRVFLENKSCNLCCTFSCHWTTTPNPFYLHIPLSPVPPLPPPPTLSCASSTHSSPSTSHSLLCLIHSQLFFIFYIMVYLFRTVQPNHGLPIWPNALLVHSRVKSMLKMLTLYCAVTTEKSPLQPNVNTLYPPGQSEYSHANEDDGELFDGYKAMGYSEQRSILFANEITS